MASERARADGHAAAGQARERAVEPPPVLRAGAGGATVAQMVVGLAPGWPWQRRARAPGAPLRHGRAKVSMAYMSTPRSAPTLAPTRVRGSSSKAGGGLPWGGLLASRGGRRVGAAAWW